MKTNHMRHFGRFFGLALLAAGPSAMAAPVGVADNFESATLGNLDAAIWSETFHPGPVGDEDLTQEYLYQVAAGAGVGGSQGVTLDGNVAKIGYNTVRITPALTGDFFILESKFQMTIGENVPLAANQGIIALEVNSAGNWFSGSNFGVTLVRRDNGKRYGISGLGLPAPQGWEQNSEIGLPNALPGAGLTATSSWFTMRLTLKDLGDDLWDAKTQILNATGVEVWTSSNLGISIPGIPSGATLYGRVSVPFANRPVVPATDPPTQEPQTNPIAEGGVTALKLDEYSFFGYSDLVDADSDTLSEAEEAALGTSDLLADTDGDTFSDSTEVSDGTNPLDISSYVGAPASAVENFNSLPIGTPATTLWSSKWESSNPSQRLRWAVAAANGTGGSQGFALDVSKAWRAYHTINIKPVAGDVVSLSSDFNFATTGAPLNEEPAPGVNGVNDGIFGLRLSTLPNWWEGTTFDFLVCRREDNIWGVLVDGTLAGWINNSAIGLEPGLTPDISDFFQMKMVVKESADPLNVGRMEAVCTVSYQGTALYTSDPKLMNASFAPGVEVYGGMTTGWNSDPSNGTLPKVDPADAATVTPVGLIGKISAVNADNFGITGYSDAEDIDGDNLSQAQEALLGTNDLKQDTDNDTHNDDVEVTAGTDPLDPLSFPGSATPLPIVITSYTFTGGNTVNISFTSNPSTSFKLTQSETLVAPFTQVGTTSTDGSGVGTFNYVIPPPVPAKNFFRVER